MSETNKSTFKCDICQDVEWIINGNGNAEPCKCREQRYYERILDLSGISAAFRNKTVNGYIAKHEPQKAARSKAIEFIQSFESIRSERNNSLAFLGNPGSGKTHLTIAIANALLKQGVGVLYMQYREVMTYLKQIIRDDEQYQREISKYEKAPVLLIDDLFKGVVRQGIPNESEIGIMFEIINHRYLKGKPILVSSEHVISKMLDFDEATGSRIAEMCKGRIVELVGNELNYRMED